MQPVSLALLWHQHQPYYPDSVGGDNPMPWVRLHGTKDYYGMALHIKEVPEFRCTINLVPSLLQQLIGYVDNGASDQHLDISRMPADGLSHDQACYLLDHFFMANVDNMIRPFSRYYGLYLRRGWGTDTAEQALPRFSERDIRDLQVWSNLTWIHPLVFEDDSDLRDFRDKGSGWSEDEKHWLLDKQMEILGKIIPLHRDLAVGGQLELTTTPFFHPILPLLWDKRSARQAMPGCNLPKNLEAYTEDALAQLQRAVRFHEQLFGIPPLGMWPSEGSVSQEIVGAIADLGIEWIATDEEILAESTGGWVSRDEHGHVRHPEMLYRPWRVTDEGKQLQMVFRDHAMSDLIGFHYQRSDPASAAFDLLGKLQGIGQAVESLNAGRPALVPIILDGENCWEYYPDGGVKFLRTLYQESVRNASIRPVRMNDHLREYPAVDRISQLYAGSWISHNFAIWIGHHEDNTAWDLLHETRAFLKRTEAEGTVTADILKRAWEEIYIAEGSDWFWWFGDDHSSPQDALFDQLFRQHLRNVYQLLGVRVPAAIDQPISCTERRSIHTSPTGFSPVKVDGRCSYFEWINAGRYVSGNERGTMTLVSDGLIREVYFGFNAEYLMIRIDTAKSARDDLSDVDQIHICFLEPADMEIRIAGLKTGVTSATLYCKNHEVAAAVPIETAIAQVLEMKCAFSNLGRTPGDPLQFFVEVFAHQHSIDRAPREGLLESSTPSADFEMMMWHV